MTTFNLDAFLKLKAKDADSAIMDKAIVERMIHHRLETGLAILDSDFELVGYSAFSSYDEYPGEYAGQRSKHQSFNLRAYLKRLSANPEFKPDDLSAVHYRGPAALFERFAQDCATTLGKHVEVSYYKQSPDEIRTDYHIQRNLHEIQRQNTLIQALQAEGTSTKEVRTLTPA